MFFLFCILRKLESWSLPMSVHDCIIEIIWYEEKESHIPSCCSQLQRRFSETLGEMVEGKIYWLRRAIFKIETTLFCTFTVKEKQEQAERVCTPKCSCLLGPIERFLINRHKPCSLHSVDFRAFPVPHSYNLIHFVELRNFLPCPLSDKYNMHETWWFFLDLTF